MMRLGLSLFWRTFFMLVMLLAGSILAWLQTFRALEFEPSAVQTAHQVASLVNLSRAAMLHTDSISRVSLIKALTDQEGVRIQPREPGDKYAPFMSSDLEQRITQELTRRLGAGTIVASSVNGEPGLWVAFAMDKDSFWLLLDRERFDPGDSKTWLIWLITAAALSVAGAALIARLVNQPLKRLSFAASRVREGDFDASQLDESSATNEIREVNIGFNRMARQLSKIEQDRAVMLAGISHDLRTPLARLRLETEMSVANEEARNHMAADIDQLDAIIDKFLEYARPDLPPLQRVPLGMVIDECLYAIKDQPEIQVIADVPGWLQVVGDSVELRRVVSNLLENARRYGRSPGTNVARVDITAKASDEWVLLKIRDHGTGVPPDMLSSLTKPFFRGDSARTAANGAGLGLAIVEKTLSRMGGQLELVNGGTNGLVANIRLRNAA